MSEVTTVVEAAEAVAPAVTAGTLDYKKVAMYAGGAIVVAGCGYAAYRIIKKRKAAKALPTVEVNPEEVPVEAEPVQ